MATLASRTFVFVTGVEGSGTSLVLRLLSAPSCALALGGNYVSPNRPGYDCVANCARLNALTRGLWNTAAPPTRLQARKGRRAVNDLAVPDDVRFVIHKRSYPFEAAGFYPRLADVLEIGARSRIVVLTRDPRSCSASVLRRGFVATIEEAAERVAKAGAMLRDQLQSLPAAACLALAYEEMLRSPAETAAALERFLDYPQGSLVAHAALIDRPTDQSSQLAEVHRRFLDQRFAGRSQA